MATVINLLSSSCHSITSLSHQKLHPLSSSPFLQTQLKCDQSLGHGKQVLLSIKCLNEPSRDAVEPEPDSGSTGIWSNSLCGGFGALRFLEKIREVAGLQLCVAGLVVAAALSNPYSAAAERFGEKFLPYAPTEIKASSSPLALKLAAHLRSVGAKMYGAFWCSHCLEQKEIFGREAAKLLDYGECYPGGFKIGTPLSQECKKVKIEGFPMWVINGQVLEGFQEFPELAKVSGFEAGEFSKELAELAKQSVEANMQP